MNDIILKKVVSADDRRQLQIELPEGADDREYEVVVRRVAESADSGSKSGFVDQVLADTAEDVWNDL